MRYELQATKQQARPSKQDKINEAIYCKARMAGLEAARACRPVPMVVQQHANMLDDKSPVEKQWFVSGGVCGFAWVVVSPGTCSFARWARKNIGAHLDYYGGVGISAGDREFGQSMQIKEAYAEAFARVLQENGIRAYMNSRMD